MGNIYLKFDINGAIVKVDAQSIVRQGELKKTKLVALIPTSVSVAMGGQLTIQRADGKIGTDITMLESTETYEDVLYRSFSAYLDGDEWLSAIDGETKAQVSFNTANGTIVMNGTYTYNIQKTIYDENPQISVQQYDELLIAIEGKQNAYSLNNVRGYDSQTSAEMDLDNLAVGQIFIIDNADADKTQKICRKMKIMKLRNYKLKRNTMKWVISSVYIMQQKVSLMIYIYFHIQLKIILLVGKIHIKCKKVKEHLWMVVESF